MKTRNETADVTKLLRDKDVNETLLHQLKHAIVEGKLDQVFDLAARLVAASGRIIRPDPLNLTDVAIEMRVSTRTLWRVLGSDKKFPKPFRVGGSLRWRRSDIEKFKAQPNGPP